MPSKDPDTPQDIEELRKRHKRLEEQKIAAKTKLEASQQTLDELKQQARERHGTDDLEELRRKLEAMKLENERKRADYQRLLDEIERQLAEVEQQHAEAARRESQA